jgi:hypothetical protein
MISYLRRALANKIVFRIVIWATVVALGCSMFVVGLFKRFGRNPQMVPEVVNGYQITNWELRRRVDHENQRINMIRRQYGNQADLVLRMQGMSETNVQEHALAALRQQKLLVYAADQLGLDLSSEYVGHKLGDKNFMLVHMGDYVHPNMVSGDMINYDALYKILQRQGLSPACFETVVDERLKGVAVLNVANGGIYVPKSDLLDTYNSYYRRKKFMVVKVPLAAYSKQLEAKPVEEAALKSFYTSTPDNYIKPAKRSGVYWAFTQGSEQFKNDAMAAVNGDSKTFEAFVSKYKGVKHPLGPTTFRADALTKALFELPAGKRGAFVEGKQGFVVQTDMIEPQVQQTYEQVKDKVRADYLRSQASARASNELEALKRMDKQALQAWVAAHKNYGIQTSTTGFLDQHNEHGWKELQDQLGGGLYQVAMMSQEGQVAVIMTRDNAYVVQLEQFEATDPKAFEQKQAELRTILDNANVGLWMSGFIASLEKNATIESKNKP